MSKRRSVAIVSSSPKIAANSPTFPPQNDQRPDANTNWNLCFICQKQTKEKLQSAKDAVIIGNHINSL